MAIFRRVSVSFWTDPKVDDRFSPEDKYFFLYLLTNPHTSLCGCYQISYKQLITETGYSADTINALIDRFERVYNMIRYDKNTSEMLILNWKKYNWSSSPSFSTSFNKELKGIKSRDFLAFLNGDEHSVDTVSDSVDTVSKTPIPLSVTNTDNSNKSINQEDKTSKETKRTRKKYEDTPEFKAFWDAYPVHANKVGAREAFAKADAPLEVLLEAIETWKRTDQWKKDGGQFIPYPAKWLKERRWEDSPKVNMPKSDGMERYRNLQRLAEEFEDE